MTEDEAVTWLSDIGVPRGTIDRLARLATLIRDEMPRQNLIAASTEPHIWARHIVDSAQLLPLAQGTEGEWVDLGSGAGFPGLVVAIVQDRPVLLIESRRKRAEFLQSVAADLSLANCSVHLGRVETLPPREAAVISARAFASLDRTFAAACHLGDRKTRWVLPKGRNAREELEAARKTWQGEFHVEQSITDPESAIIVAQRVRRREAI